jgi:hypothetical protein
MGAASFPVDAWGAAWCGDEAYPDVPNMTWIYGGQRYGVTRYWCSDGCRSAWAQLHAKAEPPEPAPPTGQPFDPDGCAKVVFTCVYKAGHEGDCIPSRPAPPTVAPARPAREVARELAHRLHPVQMATCMCDSGITRTPGAWCEKVTGILTEALERDRASRSPGRLGGLDAATVEACAASVEAGARHAMGCDCAECVHARQAVARIRALATPPGQTKP